MNNVFTNIKLSFKLDDIKILNIDNNKIKFKVQIRKENDKFKLLYEGANKNFNIKGLDDNANYEIRICSFYNDMLSNWTQIYKIKTTFIDSIILNKHERKKEFLEKILEWIGCKSMELLYRGTRDGMTTNDFHNKCDNKGKTICLFLNDKGNIFGGYSSILWTKDEGDKIAQDCFLFTLTNIYNIEPTKFPYVKERSVRHCKHYCPIFGEVAIYILVKNQVILQKIILTEQIFQNLMKMF